MFLVIEGVVVEIPRFFYSTPAASFTFIIKVPVQDLAPHRYHPHSQEEERTWRLILGPEFEIFNEQDPSPRRDLRKLIRFFNLYEESLQPITIPRLIGCYLATAFAEYSSRSSAMAGKLVNNLVIKLPLELSKIMKAQEIFKEGIRQGWDIACGILHSPYLSPETSPKATKVIHVSPPFFPPPPEETLPEEPTLPPPPPESPILKESAKLPPRPELPPAATTKVANVLDNIDRFLREDRDKTPTPPPEFPPLK